MKPKLQISLILLFLFLHLTPFPNFSLAGKLDDLEKDVAEKKSPSEERSAVYDEQVDPITGQVYPDNIGEAIGGSILDGLLSGMLFIYGMGVEGSLKRINGDSTATDGLLYTPRELGEPLIPYLRTDIRFQDVESDIEAIDSRVEAGYGPFAVQGRWTHYDENSPDSQLELIQAHGLLRGSFGNHVEIDLGLGGMWLSGRQVQSAFSVTTPILFHPWKFIGLEFRPSWGFFENKTIQDYDLGVRLGWNYAGIQAGYRWVRSNNFSLNGPYIGGTISF